MEAESKNFSCEKIVNNFYQGLKNKYFEVAISAERQNYLSEKMQKYGYIPYPYIKALKELSNEEVFFCLEQKWEKEGVFSNGVFHFSDISVLARNNVKNANWLKRECHDIKLINLSGLGDGNTKKQAVSFMDWLRQLVILPAGSKENNIFSTTIYLTPFHPRAFGCAYIPQASCVSPNLTDKSILRDMGLNADEQVKMFIYFAQLAGHPVIYDILPQTGRFSKTVLTNPACVRWFDVNALIEQICSALDKIWLNSGKRVLSQELLTKYSKTDIDNAVLIYKKILKGERKFSLNEQVKEILNNIDKDNTLREYKKTISFQMQDKKTQYILHQKVQNIIIKQTANLFGKIKEENIKNRDEIETILIKAGLWPMPGGAWNSSGVPVFDKMAKGALYPIVRHYNYKGEDVTKSANLDCQSPFYFVYLESGEYNTEIIDFYVDYVKKLVAEFNFDGIRVDHLNHVVDNLSELNGVPISYRAPRIVLNRLNSEIKNQIPYFASIAEYMLWDSFYKEYHQDMKFDVLWGNDIPSQSFKTPLVIDSDNYNLAQYNRTLNDTSFVSVLKTYNNQDGEYEYINMYPAQLEREGALFKWFKYKFMPGGYYAPRPIMYVDGDESFTKGGIEKAICGEALMKRNDDMDFYAKFDAIDRFAKNNSIICYGEAHILKQEEDGFVQWQIQGNDTENVLLVIANYNSPKELFPADNGAENGLQFKIGQEVSNKTVQLHENYFIVSEYKFDGNDYTEEAFNEKINSLFIKSLKPAEFRFFRVKK